MVLNFDNGDGTGTCTGISSADGTLALPLYTVAGNVNSSSLSAWDGGGGLVGENLGGVITDPPLSLIASEESDEILTCPAIRPPNHLGPVLFGFVGVGPGTGLEELGSCPLPPVTEKSGEMDESEEILTVPATGPPNVPALAAGFIGV